ncbi:ATP-binding cassette domain-containing protein [Streptosporangium lutulentum]
MAILGPSGCGKSTLLRLVAGLDEPTSGDVVVEGRKVRGIEERCAVVFQEPRLLPWLDLVGNVALGLPRGTPRASGREAVRRWLEVVGLDRFHRHRPRQISGGMAQRTALARALARRPGVLLLDEPFAALDALTRLRMQDLLADVQRRANTTVLLVTHDVDEALHLADRVILLGGEEPHEGATVLTVLDVPYPVPETAVTPNSPPCARTFLTASAFPVPPPSRRPRDDSPPSLSCLHPARDPGDGVRVRRGHRRPGRRGAAARLRLLQPAQPCRPQAGLAGTGAFRQGDQGHLGPVGGEQQGQREPARRDDRRRLHGRGGRTPGPGQRHRHQGDRGVQRPEWAALVVAKTSSITGIAGLKGRKVAATKGTDPYFFLLQSLHEAKLTGADVEVVNLQHADGKTALERGDVDAWAGLDPLMAQSQIDAGSKLIYRNPAFTSYGFLNAREAFIKDHPDLVQSVVNAYEKARAWIGAHPDETVTLLAEEAKLSPEIAKLVLTERTKTEISPVPGPEQRAVLERILPILVEENQVRSADEARAALDSLFDPAFAEKAHAS